jgi:hypothetical protein
MIHALIFSLLVSPIFAQTNSITGFDVTGGFSREYENSSDPKFEVYGGFDSTCTGTTTCNTCGTGALTDPTDSCNARAINASSVVRFSFKSGKNVQNYFIITKDNDNDNYFKQSTTQINANATGDLDVTWGELCAEFDTANPGCTNPEDQTIFRIGLDVNNDSKLTPTDDYIRVKFALFPKISGAGVTKSALCSQDTSVAGICDYSVLRGDEKVYLASYNTTSGFPTVSSIAYSAIRLYYTTSTDCTTASYSHSQFQEFTLGKSGNNFTSTIAGEPVVTGLTNGTSYCFRGAVVDKAGNIKGFTTRSTMNSNEDGHLAIPEEVNGLLEDGNCFIATAAYGNPLNEKIDTFRQFRDEILLKFSWGKKLVTFYYDNSKPLAIEIFKHPWAQTITRAVLWPIWLVIEVVLNYPIVLVVIGLLLIASARRRKNAI